MSDPLVTRSQPEGLWQLVPLRLHSWDMQVQDEWAASIDQLATPWRQFIWLTEKPQGIACMLLIIFTLILLSQRAEWPAWRARWREKCFLVLAFIALAGLSDLLSNGLKKVVGRLKPHVIWWHPESMPALSFPSSHAFNSSLLFFALLTFWTSAQRARHQSLLVLFGLFVVIIGLTRVLFNQHYPLDVLGGWGLGGAVGALLGRHVLRRAFSGKKNRESLGRGPRGIKP